MVFQTRFTASMIDGTYMSNFKLFTPDAWRGWDFVKPIFLARLKELQKHPTTVTAYRKPIKCKLCHAKIKRFKYLRHGQEWHSAVAHVVGEHDGVVTQEFWEFVVKATSHIVKAIPEEIQYMNDKPKRKPNWTINVDGSSNIAQAKYNVKKEKLLIQFAGGAKYVYSDVDLDTIVEFTLADSVGSYFHKNIRNRFEAKKQ